MKNNYLTETKVSRKKNKGNSYSYSTAIPKVILNKFNLKKGTKLYWDIQDSSILITPELPEEESINAGLDILKDFIVNGNNHYSTYSKTIIAKLQQDKDKDAITEELVQDYKMETNEEYKEYYKKVVLYLLDYPLGIETQYEILNAVYNEITKD